MASQAVGLAKRGRADDGAGVVAERPAVRGFALDEQMAKRLNIELIPRPQGRPRKQKMN